MQVTTVPPVEKKYNVSAFGAIGDTEYRLSWSDAEHGNRETPDGELEDTEFSSDSIMAYLAYTIDNHSFGLNYDQFNLDSEIATGMPGFQLDMPQRDREKIGVFYNGDELSDTLKKLHLDIYQQTIDRQFVQHMEMPMRGLPPTMTGSMPRIKSLKTLTTTPK